MGALPIRVMAVNRGLAPAPTPASALLWTIKEHILITRLLRHLMHTIVRYTNQLLLIDTARRGLNMRNSLLAATRSHMSLRSVPAWAYLTRKPHKVRV